MDRQEFDLIVIGSGIGSLAVASLMAQLRDRRVLVLERHFKPGGFTHTFRRPGGYEWDVGVHYIGDMNEGNLMRDLMDLVTQGQVIWNKMPSPYDVFVYPDQAFAVPEGVQAFQSALLSAFPDERDAIQQYLREVKRMYDWNSLRMMANAWRPPLRGIIRWFCTRFRLPFESTASYLKRRFRDQRLQGILASQWGAYGLPQSQAPFFIHATMVQHFIRGGYYPVGGGGAIAESVLPIIERRGGCCKVNHRVRQILVEQGKAIGVQVDMRQGKSVTQTEYYAPVIVSGAGAYTTYKHLVPPQFSRPFQDKLDDLAESGSFVTLYLGLKESPRRLGFRGENHWLFTGYDHDDLYNRRNLLAQGQAVGAYLSFPSLKNPSSKRHTAEIIAALDYELVQDWRAQPWRRRDCSYEALKERITQALLNIVEQHYPGFQDLIEFCELSTPITIEHFTGHHRGAIYGLPATKQRFQASWLTAETPVKHLLLTGSDIANLGVAGGLFGGVITAACLHGNLGLFKIIAAAKSRRWKQWIDKKRA
jgi:all-trans-retinol 13,14-reductase